MAYRFLLEIPATLSATANVAVSTADDAQVVVERPAHGLGFDDPYVNLTVAAHSLQVVNNLYQWADEIGATRADSRLLVGIVLHSGQRIGLHEIDGPGLVAAIRRDQPWVERSVPKIGDHERDTGVSATPSAAAGEVKAAAVAVIDQPAASSITAVNLIDAEEELSARGRNYAVIQVTELPGAERFYGDILDLRLDQRMRQNANGVWEELGDDYDHAAASHNNTEADIAFMHNGPLNVALVRAGRAARLDYANVHNQIAMSVQPAMAAKIKATVLMRGYTMLTSTGPAYSFRDPFGVVWNVHPHQVQV